MRATRSPTRNSHIIDVEQDGGGTVGLVTAAGTTVDFSKVMERMRRLRTDISPHDSAKRFTELGVDVFLGAGKFTGPDSIEVGGQTLRSPKPSSPPALATHALPDGPSI